MPAPTVTSAQVIERITVLVEALTPTLCPSVLFRRHEETDCKLQYVTDPARFRLIKVSLENPRISQWASKAGSSTNFDKALRLRIGYPAADYYPEDPDEVDADGNRHLTEDLKEMDVELIRRLLDGTPFAANLELGLLLLPGVKLTRFAGASDAFDGQVKDIFYDLAFGRV